MQRRWPIRRILVAVILLGFLCWCAWIVFWGSKLKIGRETTFVTGPVTSDGMIDYAAALHQLLSVGVKPEDNAAILIDRAFGPGAISPELRPRYFEWISTEPLPEQGDYVLPQGTFMQQKLEVPNAPANLKDTMSNEFQRSSQSPWTRLDCPLVAEWLNVNAKPLELIEQASNRSQYYSPLVATKGLTDGETQEQNLRQVADLREAARLLLVRARLRLGENNIPGAWNDLQACHRLARLVSQRAPSIVAYQVAIAMNSMAARGDETLVAYELSADQARKCLEEHAKLLPFGSLVDLIHHQQRMEFLDGLSQLDLLTTRLFINTALRRSNHVFDEFVSTLNEDGYKNRVKAMVAIETDLKQRTAPAQKPTTQIVKQLMNPGESDADVMLSLLSPSIFQTISSETRIQVRHDLVQIGFALAAYHAEQGTYSSTLDDLVPRYLGSVPLDKYTDQALIYVPNENGFLVYSVGANGRDDGGRRTRGINDDDVSFEIPQRFDE